MTSRRPRKQPGARAGPGAVLDPKRLPALVAFLRGYLHEDWVDEHGSLAAAVAAFARDASPPERAALAADWSKFEAAVAGRTVAAARRALTDDLGSRWAPASAGEIAELGAAVKRAAPST